jgi:hypothetical protein
MACRSRTRNQGVGVKLEKTLFKGVKNYFKRVYIIKSIKFKGNFKNLGTMDSPQGWE